MSTEFVQIGNFFISKVVFEAVILLTSVVVGGVITYLTTRTLEYQKWNQQKKEKLQEQRREALGHALEWIAPIEIAMSDSNILASAFIEKNISEDDFRTQWPNLVSELAKKVIPARFSVLLPSSSYKLSLQIIRQLRELYINSLHSQGVTTWEKLAPIYNKYMEQAAEIDKTLVTLRKELTDEYMKTFE